MYTAKREYCIRPVKRRMAKPKSLYNQNRARVKGENPSILALFVFYGFLSIAAVKKVLKKIKLF